MKRHSDSYFVLDSELLGKVPFFAAYIRVALCMHYRSSRVEMFSEEVVMRTVGYFMLFVTVTMFSNSARSESGCRFSVIQSAAHGLHEKLDRLDDWTKANCSLIREIESDAWKLFEAANSFTSPKCPVSRTIDHVYREAREFSQCNQENLSKLNERALLISSRLRGIETVVTKQGRALASLP